MPLYSYRCDHCGVQFDRQQHFNEPTLRKCPECGKLALRKLIAPVGIVFKGSGFYSTDHRSTAGLKSSKSEKTEAKTDQAEAKPAANAGASDD